MEMLIMSQNVLKEKIINYLSLNVSPQLKAQLSKFRFYSSLIYSSSSYWASIVSGLGWALGIQE